MTWIGIGVGILRGRISRMFATVFRILRWLPLVVLSSGLVLWGISRLAYPTRSQTLVLESLRAPPQAPGRNAFAAIWLLHYDVPESEWTEIVTQDIRAFRMRSPSDREDDPKAPFLTSARGRYLQLSPYELQYDFSFCAPSDDCIEAVSADLETYGASLRQHARMLDRIETLDRYDRFSRPFPANEDDLSESARHIGLLRTRKAHAFLTGDPWAAVEDVCRSIVAYHRITTNSDSMFIAFNLDSLAAIADAAMLGEMLRRLPADRALPKSCEALSTPQPVSADAFCGYLKHEAGSILTGIETDPLFDKARRQTSALRALDRFLYDRSATRAGVAEDIGYFCGAEFRSLLTADELAKAPNGRRGNFSCFGNLGGCAVRDSYWRDTFFAMATAIADNNARMRLLSLLIHIRDLRARDSRFRLGPQQFDALAAEYGLSKRRPRISRDGTALLIDVHLSKSDAVWRLPVSADWLSPDMCTALGRDHPSACAE